MILEKLTIKNFRNHNAKSFIFSKGINAFIGDNGVGKTNIIEAIYYLSLGRSFRTKELEHLIKSDEDRAYIIASILEGDIRKEIRISISKEGRSVVINKKPINKLSILSNAVNVLLFEPKDVNLFRGSPKARRDFLDLNISKKSEVYLYNITTIEKILKDRNDCLKQLNPDLTLLDTQTDLLIKHSKPVIEARKDYLSKLEKIANKIIVRLTDNKMVIKIDYHPFVNFNGNFETTAKDCFTKNLENDLKRKSTSVGVHLEDFDVYLNNQNIIDGSQGENRLVAITLKIAPYFLIDDENKKPIVALDDVLSELDINHQKKLLDFISKLNQTFITTTQLKNNKSKIFLIKKGEK